MFCSVPEQEKENLVYFVLLRVCMEVLQSNYYLQEIGC